MVSSRFAAALATLFWPLALLSLILALGVARLIYLLPANRPRQPDSRTRKQDAGYILVVLGSGGHTTEMFMLLKDLDTTKYQTRRYVISEADNHSLNKMQDFENKLEAEAAAEGIHYGTYDYKIVPRARKIHQSLLSTPRSAMTTFLACLRVFRRTSGSTQIYPNIIIANGPATAFMLICAAFILRYLRVPGTRDTLRCIYVESWARLTRLSLTGRLLRWTGLCDRFLVQWPKLEARGARKRQLGEYQGPLVI